jgi:hypothetical protein
VPKQVAPAHGRRDVEIAQEWLVFDIDQNAERPSPACQRRGNLVLEARYIEDGQARQPVAVVRPDIHGMDAGFSQVCPALGQRFTGSGEADFRFGRIENERKHNPLLRNQKFYTEVGADRL